MKRARRRWPRLRFVNNHFTRARVYLAGSRGNAEMRGIEKEREKEREREREREREIGRERKGDKRKIENERERGREKERKGRGYSVLRVYSREYRAQECCTLLFSYSSCSIASSFFSSISSSFTFSSPPYSITSSSTFNTFSFETSVFAPRTTDVPGEKEKK